MANERFILDMSCDYYGTFFVFVLFIKTIHSCGNISLTQQTFGHIENVNFFMGKSQPKNLSCSWRIHNEKPGDFIVSLRIIEVEHDQKLWSNELIFKTDVKQIVVNNINQRTFYILSSSNFDIDFRVKSPISQSTSLNIHRFFLEFSQVNNNHNSKDNFRCIKSGLIIPKQWKCNCLYECGFNDYSDEDNCPLCSMMKSSNSLLCHSNEFWCLPVMNQADSKGVCVTFEQSVQCSYSTKCETIVTYAQDHGEILLNNLVLSDRESLCFVIMAREKHQLRLIVNQYNFVYQRPDLELFVYDGDQARNQLLLSSNSLSARQTVQTQQNHLSTIVIRKRSTANKNSHIDDDVDDDSDNFSLNITWLTSICPNNQFLCGGHFEIKCYSKEQRCDGIWDCISGDDELGCLPSSCPTTFACHNQLRLPSDQPRCYIWYERCNGNAYCPNRTDEQNCTNWWCNSNNGTFLCKNRYCIYETWVCDGTDDCGDNSDEINCPIRVPRRIMTAITIGATICCTLLLIALGCTCKLFHLRSAEQRASTRLSNPQEYIEQRHSDDSQRIAPPSYNQTMGFSNDNDDRHAILAEQLRLAGLANFIPLRSRHRNRRHRRHRHRRNHQEDSHDASIEPSSNPFDRFRSLFNRNLSINNNSVPTNEFDISAITPMIASHESRELPPAYSEERLLSLSVPTIEDAEQATSDDDDDKMLVP